MKPTHRCGRAVNGQTEVLHRAGGAVEPLGEVSQQVAHLVRHVVYGDLVPGGSRARGAVGQPPLAAGAVDALGQLAEKEAAGQVSVELAQSGLRLQEIPQTGTVLQQQPHKLRLVSNQGGEQSVVQVAALEQTCRRGQSEHPSPLSSAIIYCSTHSIHSNTHT